MIGIRQPNGNKGLISCSCYIQPSDQTLGYQNVSIFNDVITVIVGPAFWWPTLDRPVEAKFMALNYWQAEKQQTSGKSGNVDGAG